MGATETMGGMGLSQHEVLVAMSAAMSMAVGALALYAAMPAWPGPRRKGAARR